MADFLSAELINALPRLIFLGVIMTAFGYAAGNARQLTGWKVGLLLIVVWMFLEQFNHGRAALFVMLGAFLVGYLLPQAHALEGFGRSISEVINNLRYRSAYADIKRELERAEQLRREYEAMQKDQLRQQAEAERQRRRQHSRGGQQSGGQSAGRSSQPGDSDGDGSGSDGRRRRRRRPSSNDDNSRANGSSSGSKRRSSSGSGRSTSSGSGSSGTSNGYKRTKHQKASTGHSGSSTGKRRSGQSTNQGRSQQQQNSSSYQQRSSSNQAPPSPPPALNALRDKYLVEIDLTPGQDYKKAEIKKAYRRMAIKCHPDKHQGSSQAVIDKMTEQFRRITTAYDWLYVRAPA